jgi:hypothetical protein
MTTIVSQRLFQQYARTQPACAFCRGFTSSSPWFAGHNKWSSIKHDKAKNDKAKSKERQIIGKEISSAVQSILLNNSLLVCVQADSYT